MNVHYVIENKISLKIHQFFCIVLNAIQLFVLITNKKNHPNLNRDYIIKNNERSIKCLLHPNEKNLAFCLKCNRHICKKCKKKKDIKTTKHTV